jgi:BioD-like phosphotransacetylase family protein
MNQEPNTMKSLYVTSAEIFSGKSALCVGLGAHFRKDGFKTGYMKPVNVNCPLYEGLVLDEDVVFAKQMFDMPEPMDLLLPVALTPGKLEQQLRGPETDFQPRLLDHFAKVSAGRDIMILEGGRSMREGYVAGLPPLSVVELLDARVLMVIKYDDTLMVDRAMAAKNYFGDRLLGAVFNETPLDRVDNVLGAIVPFLERHNVATLGVVRRERLLAAPSVRELAEGLHAEILCCTDKLDELVEHLLVGGMGADAALSYFRRKPHKAVIAGGDRTDLLLAALETSTRCLILTGNIYPSPPVLNRAEEQQVPVLLCSLDTMSTVDVAEDYFERSRFQQPQKIEMFTALLEKYMDFDLLYKNLDVSR